MGTAQVELVTVSFPIIPNNGIEIEIYNYGTFLFQNPNSIFVDLGGGDDAFTIGGTDLPGDLVIDLGSGNDRMSLGTYMNFHGDVEIRLGNGNNTII